MPYRENLSPSRLERKCARLLDQGDILYVTEFSFPDLKSQSGIPLRFDFALFETVEDLNNERPKALIELQGIQHFELRFGSKRDFHKQKSNDKRKRAYCAAKGIRFVAIPYTEYHVMTLDLILEACHFFD